MLDWISVRITNEMTICKLILICLLYMTALADENCTATTQPTTKKLATIESLLLISTLDGTLHAVGKENGHVKWKLDEDPILAVPMDTSMIKGPTFLPDPKDGTLYAFEPTSLGLTKLPFTIPELVQAAPCRSSDNILYTGRKQDTWIAVNPVTGSKERIITTDYTIDKCPGGISDNIFIGRSEYKITMYDTKKDEMRWNATYKDYSAHVNEKVSHDYELLHFASSSDGYLITIDRKTGRILWANNYGYPVVGMYVYGGETGLQKVNMMSMAKETLTYFMQQQNGHIALWDNILHFGEKMSDSTTETELLPTLYVGQYLNSLYALPAMRHEGVGSHQQLLLLPGPDDKKIPTSQSTALQADITVPSWRLVGYHEIPKTSGVKFPPSKKESEENPKFPLLTQQKKESQTEESESGQDYGAPIQPPLSPIHEFVRKNRNLEHLRWLYARYQKGRHKRNRPSLDASKEKDKEKETVTPSGTRWDEITMVAVLTSFFTGVVFLILTSKTYFAPSDPKSSESLSRTADGWMRVGQIIFDPIEILGRGSEGTVVYRGTYDGRDVAVKRIVPQCFTFADREVALLRESDEHIHVIRYYCTEKDTQFRYIALELCSNTLQEFVENPQFQCSVGLERTAVLYQAMQGIEHLHSLGIVHRDVKPSNILISLPNQLGHQRVVISDFGLCKKLVAGRCSFSQRSGMAGTDGWIAPEMIMTDKYRMTRAVDIFSMGCVFYYVLCGKHPFGDALTRQVRIIAGDYSFEELKDLEDFSEASDIIQCMLYLEPKLRPTASTVLKHPLFWSHEKKLQFFQDVSDRAEKESIDSALMQKLEQESKLYVIGEDWRVHLSMPLQLDLKKFRNYRGELVRDLLRAMRNKKHHYRELPDDVKLSLGSIPDEFLFYFMSRFPNLLLHTYHSLAVCRREKMFQQYYGPNPKNHLFSRELPYMKHGKHLTVDSMFGENNIWNSRSNGSGQGSSIADSDMNWRAGARSVQCEENSLFDYKSSRSNSENSSEASFKSASRNSRSSLLKLTSKFADSKLNQAQRESAKERRNAPANDPRPAPQNGVTKLLSYASIVNSGAMSMQSAPEAKLHKNLSHLNRSPRVSESSSASNSSFSVVKYSVEESPGNPDPKEITRTLENSIVTDTGSQSEHDEVSSEVVLIKDIGGEGTPADVEGQSIDVGQRQSSVVESGEPNHCDVEDEPVPDSIVGTPLGGKKGKHKRPRRGKKKKSKFNESDPPHDGTPEPVE